MFVRIMLQAVLSASIKLAKAAPRDKASNPTAPVPAKTSIICAFCRGGEKRPPISKLKIASRLRWLVGRVVFPATEVSFVPRAVPPIICIIYDLDLDDRNLSACGLADLRWSDFEAPDCDLAGLR